MLLILIVLLLSLFFSSVKLAASSPDNETVKAPVAAFPVLVIVTVADGRLV